MKLLNPVLTETQRNLAYFIINSVIDYHNKPLNKIPFIDSYVFGNLELSYDFSDFDFLYTRLSDIKKDLEELQKHKIWQKVGNNGVSNMVIFVGVNYREHPINTVNVIIFLDAIEYFVRRSKAFREYKEKPYYKGSPMKPTYLLDLSMEEKEFNEMMKRIVEHEEIKAFVKRSYAEFKKEEQAEKSRKNRFG